MEKTGNPWLNISWQNTIADCDREYICKKYGSVAEYEKRYQRAGLDLSCLPEPFSGDKNCPVYCLNMNPGESIPSFQGNEGFEAETVKNLHHKVKDCYWLGNFKNKYGCHHPGIDWLDKKTGKLQKLLGRRPNMFIVEFYPYHSKRGFSFPQHLPSYDYSDSLVKEAIEQKKTIVIMRQVRRWTKRIPNLEDYDNVVILNSPAGGWLSPNNFKWHKSEKPLTEDEIRKLF